MKDILFCQRLRVPDRRAAARIPRGLPKPVLLRFTHVPCVLWIAVALAVYLAQLPQPASAEPAEEKTVNPSTPAPGTAAGTPIESTFRQALIEEEANQNLDAAIQGYRQVILDLDAQRKMAATAVFRLAECYRKLGNTNEALAQYQRVITDFSDQATLLELSRKSAMSLGWNGLSPGPTQTAQTPMQAPTEEETKEVQRIRALIQSSPDLINADFVDKGGKPLHNAAAAGQLVVARFLLANGAAVNSHSKQFKGKTPLMAAARGGHKAMVELLLAQGADANAADDDGRTALMDSAEQGYKGVVDLLLTNKANPNLVDTHGVGALELAAFAGHAEVTELLLNAGADVNAADADQQTPLAAAAQTGNRPVVELLLAKGADINRMDKSGITPLLAALVAKRTDVVRVILQHHPKVDQTDLRGRTCLFLAVALELPEMVKLLLANAASTAVSASFELGPAGVMEMTPTHVAVAKNNQEILDLLLGAKANVNATDKDGAPPLHYAVAFGRTAIARDLLEHGAQIETRARALPSARSSPGDTTALELAIILNSPAMVELLVEKGANVDSRGPSRTSPLQYCGSSTDLRILQSILQRKPDLEFRPDPGAKTPLQRAVLERNVSMAKLFAEAGANVNVLQEATQQTPIFWSVGSRDKEMVKLLLEHHAEVNLLDSEGKSPLSYLNQNGATPAPSAIPLPGMPPARFQGTALPGFLPQGAPIQSFPQNRGDDSIAQEIRSLLLKAGANPNLERQSFITISRPSFNCQRAWFKCDPKVDNRFTLLELLALGFGKRGPALNTPFPSQFPDLKAVSIRRLSPADPSKDEILKVNVQEILESGDCSKDLPLAWGDVVEIPELDHRVGESWIDNSPEFYSTLEKCLKRKVQIHIKDQSTLISLVPFDQTKFSQQEERAFPSFWLSSVVQGCGLLRTSSDTSLVHVKRRGSQTAQSADLVFDLTTNPSPTFWLQDGDVIEVPDKK